MTFGSTLPERQISSNDSLTATNIPKEPAVSVCIITLTLEAADSFETLVPIYQITCHIPGDSNIRPNTDIYLRSHMMYKGTQNPNGINVNLFQTVVMMFIPT